MTMDTFYETHSYLVEHLGTKLRRLLMDEIDPSARLIGIKGSRGVGKTTFLLQYAQEHYGAHDKRCLYVNINNFFFQGKGLVAFASDFVDCGGECLLVDQVFKLPSWSEELRECYDRFPDLQIIFTGSSVMNLDEDNAEIGDVVKSYNLRGFSFREYLNITLGLSFPPFTLDEILADHERLIKRILPYASPNKQFPVYLQQGYYPFHLEQRNFLENLLKTMNMMTEVDVLLIKQMEQKYLPQLKHLFYLLALEGIKAPNVSMLANEIGVSRATVMNYLKSLSDARLINILYHIGETFPKKPSRILLHNPNLIHAIYPIRTSEQELMETFFVNAVWRDHRVNTGQKEHHYILDGSRDFCVANARGENLKKYRDETYYVRYNTEVGRGNLLPLWILGFIY